MSDEHKEPDWERIGMICGAVLLRMAEKEKEEDDADSGLLPGIDGRAGG